MSGLREPDEGGEPACLLALLCPSCGRVPDGPRPSTCPGCGAAMEDGAPPVPPG